VIRYWIEYPEMAPPVVGADQEKLILDEPMDDDARPDACPGAAVAEPPALIEANTAVPTEYVTH
jgi:hypothetical protein